MLEFERNKVNVETALAAQQIEFPVALDTRAAFNNLYWPAHYRIDQQGRVVYTHFSEGNSIETERNIRHLLKLGIKAIFNGEQ